LSHWLNPGYINDGGVLDPERPESVLVDHRLWRPLGVMFTATKHGNRVEKPPAVYAPTTTARPADRGTHTPGYRGCPRG
jgi:hypothetical protein